MKDYYDILGLEETASADEIKKAYRKLARKYHPDRNPGDDSAEDRFKAVQEAYDVLSDEKERQRYDRARRNPFGAEFGGMHETSAGGQFYRSPDGTYVRFERAGGGAFDDGSGFGGLGDIFSRVFGAESRQPPPGPPPKNEVDVTISFEEMLRGGQAQVRLPNGRTVRIDYPMGVKDGYRVRVRDRSRSGTTYVRFRVGSHPRFRRNGSDLLTELQLNVFEAMLGTSGSIANPYGKTLKVSVPKGAQPGDRLRLRGQGIRTDDGTGDLIVVLVVTVPRDLDPDDEKAIREAAKKAGLL